MRAHIDTCSAITPCAAHLARGLPHLHHAPPSCPPLSHPPHPPRARAPSPPAHPPGQVGCGRMAGRGGRRPHLQQHHSQGHLGAAGAAVPQRVCAQPGAGRAGWARQGGGPQHGWRAGRGAGCRAACAPRGSAWLELAGCGWEGRELAAPLPPRPRITAFLSSPPGATCNDGTATPACCAPFSLLPPVGSELCACTCSASN